MKRKFLDLWCGFAREVAKLSTCERTQVGCLLLSLDGERLLSYGYNGTYRGGPNTPPTDEPGNHYWVHAEANALVKTRPVEPFIALLTHTPCYQCAMLLINANVHAVVALGRYRKLEGWNLLIGQLGCGDYDTSERLWETRDYLVSGILPRGAYLYEDSHPAPG